MKTLFLHGVPDTPALWGPLINALGMSASEAITPALPGFGTPAPPGFPATMDAYTDFLIGEAEAAAEANGGPIRILGHDWGAILTQRAASLRPDLFESWAVTNALIDSQYRGHRMARLWATPIVGEIVMAGMRDPKRMADALVEQGVPRELAEHEAGQINLEMRQCTLKLYRSARGLRFDPALEDKLADLPKKGLVLWGETDPYVGIEVAERFCARWNVPLHVERGAGHWACVERADAFAERLTKFWEAGA